MNIVPSSEIRLLRGCKLKPDYKHSIWWINPTNQYNYFAGLTKYTLSNSQYTRSGASAIKVPYTVSQLLDCNYMIITNIGHENKRYYAFIKDVQYISESTSLVEYEIDLIQTWYFECELMPCFVEREHPVTDNIGEHLVPENVNGGELITRQCGILPQFESWVIVIASSYSLNSTNTMLEQVGGCVRSGMYSGVYFNVFSLNANGIKQANTFLEKDASLFSGGSGVVSVFMMPSAFVNEDESASGKTVRWNPGKAYGDYGGYTVRNNKLYTYPYFYLRVSTPHGDSKDYRYEYFSGDTCSFKMIGDTSCTPGVMLVPEDYNCVQGGVNYDQSLTITGFPQCAYTNDAFLAFLSQMASAASAGKTALAQFMYDNGPTKNPGSLVDVGISLIRGLWDDRYDMNGQMNTTNTTALSAGALGFYQEHKMLRPENAAILDDYFDKYGYATMRVKVPNRTSRPQWNYIKTANCCINASLPTDIVTKIQNIYNNGITFWCWGDNVGNYALDNRPK